MKKRKKEKTSSNARVHHPPLPFRSSVEALPSLLSLTPSHFVFFVFFTSAICAAAPPARDISPIVESNLINATAGWLDLFATIFTRRIFIVVSFTSTGGLGHTIQSI